MIDLAIYDINGKEVDKLQIDEDALGGRVRHSLLKQAIVASHANKYVRTASTKGRGEVVGSTHKLFRQKGTGNARVGNARTGKRVGGGVTFAKSVRDSRQDMPKRQRRLACDSAVLAKLLSNDVLVVDQISFDQPKTRDFASMLGNLNIDRSCIVAIGGYDLNVYKSARNIPKIRVMPVSELNAGDICRHRKMLFSKDAIVSYLEKAKAVK